jgi:hypothetical protein
VTARRGTAPCGHPGTYVTNTFITCDLRCDMSDGVPEHVDPERTNQLCAHCGSHRVQVYPGMAHDDGRELFHCHNCLKAFLS